MRDQNGTLTFAPRLPDALTRLALTVTIQARCLAVEIARSAATYTLRAGEPLHLAHHGQPIIVTLGDPVTVPIPALSVTIEQPTQPRGRAPIPRNRP
jgi:alpha,alpha-trehalose phosphorylase